MPELKLYKTYLVYFLFIVYALITCDVSLSQITYVPFGGYSYHLIDRIDVTRYDKSTFVHTSNKPYTRKFVDSLLNFDSTRLHSGTEAFNFDYLAKDNSELTSVENNQCIVFNQFYCEDASLYNVDTENFFLKINPVLHFQLSTSPDSSKLKFINTRGIEIRGGIDNKVGFYFYATDNQARLPVYVNQRVDLANKVLPGEGRVKTFKETGVDYLSTRGYISFNAAQHIQIQFGQDKIFIGDGIRSMIWSDNSKDFLFLKLNTHVWRINYQNVFAELGNYDSTNIFNSLVQKKYAALHHLSVNITPGLNIGLFESVIFDRVDSAGNNSGYELHYLNPLIFYRAVESGLGSADNVLLGIDWKWNFLRRFSFYGQFVLDELLFGEFINGNGWWGNKYAAQAGLKYIDAFSISNFDLQYEHNFARPYIYSYEDNNGSSYTHYAQAIAHPLGANFQENIISLWYQPLPKFVVSNQLFLAVYGADTSGTNWGGNIFLDYNSFENEFGNKTAQGVTTHLILNNLVVSCQFWHNIFLDGLIIYRKTESQLAQFDTNEIYFGIGIRINEVLKPFNF